MNIRTRLTKLEHSAGVLLLDQHRCPACGGRERVAFADEPDNFGPALPYDGIDGTCRVCKKSSPGTQIVQLPSPVADFFATLPWSTSPRHRFIERLMMLKAIASRDIPAIERLTARLHERDANGMRRWQYTATEAVQ